MLRRSPLAFRAADLAALDALANELEGVPLVVTGPPGVGKSALARTFASQRSVSAKEVSLGAVSTVAELEDALAAVRGDHDAGLPDVLVADDLRSAAIGAVFAELAERSPSTLVLVTASDRALIPSARVLELRPLTLEDSTTLLVNLARAENPDWSASTADAPHLRAIAALTSGLPLGLELAAARLPVLGARALHFRLEKSFEVLGRGRERSALELAIHTAIDALEPGPREAIAQLALFEHAFSPEAAEHTVRLRGSARTLDALEALRRGNLLTTELTDVGDVRFAVPKAIAKVAADEKRRSEFDERHAEYFAALAERGDRDELLRERDQILEVARRILAVKPLTTHRAEPALRALIALGPRLFDEATVETLHALTSSTLVATQGSGARPTLVAGVQWLRGALARRRGDPRASTDLVAALSVARTVGERVLEARCVHELGHLLAAKGELASAEEHFVRASEALLGDERIAALAAAAEAARERGDLFQAAVHVVRGQELDRSHPAVSSASASLLLDEGKNDEARACARGLVLGHALHDAADLEGARAAYRSVDARGFEGIVALEANSHAEAYVLLSDAIGRAQGAPEAALYGGYLALLARRVGRTDEANVRRAAADAIANVVKRPWLDATLAALADGRSVESRSVHHRIARRIAGAAGTVVEAPPPPNALVVGPEGAWFRPPNAESAVPLRARKNLARILDAFAREPSRGFSASELFAIGWPGERAIGPSSAHRVRVAIATMRKMGLDEVIVRRDDGWGLRDGLSVKHAG